MAKLTTTDLDNLQNEQSAVSTLNANFAAIETAVEKTLSRDGTTPNTMAASLDMNSNTIINLPEATTATEPVRKAELDTMTLTGIGVSTAGFLFTNGTNLIFSRSLTGTLGEISVSNGTGVLGNPVISLPSALTFTGKTITGGVFSGIGGTFSTLSSTDTSTTLSVTANNPLNGFYVGGGSRSISWCPGSSFGCSPPAEFTSQIASITTTSGNASQSESNVFVLMNANSGACGVWATGAAFTLGQYVENGSKLYVCAQSGTSAGSGGGPTTTGSGIVDGSCTWNYAGPSYANGKAAMNVNTVATSSSGKIWNYTGGALLQLGWNGKFATGFEITTYNHSGIDPTPFGSTVIYGGYIGGLQGLPLTAALCLAPGPDPGAVGSTFGAHVGLFIAGANVIQDNHIQFATTGAINGIYSASTLTGSFIADASTAPYGINLTGTYASAALKTNSLIQINSNTAALTSGGTGTLLQVGAANGVAGRALFEGFAAGPTIILRRADTTAASPSALQAFDLIGAIAAEGYGATTYAAGARASVNFVASQAWTNTANGTQLTFATTPNNSTTQRVVFYLEQDGSTNVGTVGSFGGVLNINGSTSGTISIKPQAVAGTYNFNLPTTAGTLNDILRSGGGSSTAMSWTSPAALTKVDDTNVTLTLGGTPATALLAAASITVGWTGTLALSRLGQGTDGQLIVGQTSSSSLYKTITGDWTMSAAGAATLATVNSNVGTFGSATQASQITVNAKGLITAASGITVTPAVGSITGLGTGVATFLATPSSANMLSALTDKTGTGVNVFATSPTLVTPVLGVATATSINGNTFTTGTYTLTGSAGKTLTFSNTLTFAGTDGSTLNIGAGGTLGTAALQNTGTSGANLPFMNGTNSWSGVNTFANTTDASSTTAGGTIISGGLAVAKQIQSAGDITITKAATGTSIVRTVAGSVNMYMASIDSAGGICVFGTTGAFDVGFSPNDTERFRVQNGGGAVLGLGTAIPAGGSNVLGYKATSTSNFGVFFGSSTPTLSAAKGSLYLRSDGTTTNNRAYINTDGSTTWTAITTAA